jgi:hypothetical protein
LLSIRLTHIGGFLRARLCVLLCFLFAQHAAASCGSSSCPIDLHALGLTTTSPLVADLSFQYINQDHFLGRRDLETEHHELQTINRITTLTISDLITPRFQLTATLPYVSRSHRHVEVATGNFERWNFGAFGDAAIQARFRAYRSPTSTTADSLWLSAGVKLPTGARHKSNGEEDAEVTIQPGSGSTDYNVGATWQGGVIRNTRLTGMMGSATEIPYFASVTFRHNGAGTNRYRRGNELQVNAGSEYPITQHVTVLGQINLRVQSKDSPGSTGENIGLTGGTHLYVSPGLRYLMTRGVSVYGYVQVPVLENVNGAQLSSRENLLVGIQKRF